MAHAPTDKQVAAQLAASLGADGTNDAYVQQLYCFHDQSFERFLAEHNQAFRQLPIGATSEASDSNYPYLTGGDRDCSISTANVRVSIFDCKCVLTVTIDGSTTAFSVHKSKTESINVAESVTVTMQGEIIANFQTPAKISAGMRKAYSLKDDDLKSDTSLAWFVTFECLSVVNDANDATANGSIDDIFKRFFNTNELSTLFVPVAFLTEDELKLRPNAGDNSHFASKLALAVVPSMDADGVDKTNSIYVILQHWPHTDGIDRKGPSAPYVQQWRLPGDVVDNTMVLGKREVFNSIIDSIRQDPDPSMMDKEVKDFLSTVISSDPQARRTWSDWSADTTKGDFNWIPGPDDAQGSHAKQCADGQAAFAANGTGYDGTSGFGLSRTAANRLYFSPGFTSPQNKDYGPRLPMQSVDKTQSKSPKWSMCRIGKTNFAADSSTSNTFANATYEVFWRVYFSFTDFVNEKSTVAVSDVVFETRVGLMDGYHTWLSDLFDDEDRKLKHWIKGPDFQKDVEQAVRAKLQLFVPTTMQIHGKTCYFNNNGDLLVPFAFG